MYNDSLKIAILAKTDAEIAWAAGLFEGEGCIRHDPRTSARRLTLVSTDHDVLARFAAIVGVGSITRRARPNPDHKEQHVWQVSRWRDLEPILRAFLPYFGERRAVKARGLLADPATKQGDVCPQGHKLQGPDADVYRRRGGGIICAPCSRRRTRERRA